MEKTHAQKAKEYAALAKHYADCAEYFDDPTAAKLAEIYTKARDYHTRMAK